MWSLDRSLSEGGTVSRSGIALSRAIDRNAGGLRRIQMRASVESKYARAPEKVVEDDDLEVDVITLDDTRDRSEPGIVGYDFVPAPQTPRMNLIHRRTAN